MKARPDRERTTQAAWALAFAAVFGLALAARTVGLPLERHVFDGHEADYLRVFQGAPVPASTRLYPLLAGLYGALGRWTQDPAWLLRLNALAGALGASLGGVAIARRWGLRAGLCAAALLALSPPHVAWSGSAYNVMIPQALLLAAVAARGAWGVPLYALACGMRVELALLAPAVALVAGWRTALGAVGGLGVWGLLPTAPSLRPLSLTLPANLQLTGMIGPLGSLWGLALAGLALQRRTRPLLAAAAWTHLIAAGFDDQGDRHLLFAGFALSGLIASGQGWRRWLVLPALGLSLHGFWQLNMRYYADVDAFRATLPVEGPPPTDCVEILDDPLAPQSHWRYRGAWPEGRLCWGEEAIHHAWTSRGLHDRALRMKALYDPEPVGVQELPGGPRLIWALHP
ncbi:MAG: hypothetical protein H6739_18720 [Alphaproteobacteria bacterium]|nr:hypothetical protein [Alphaproteobacteria bacterium]